MGVRVYPKPSQKLILDFGRTVNVLDARNLLVNRE